MRHRILWLRRLRRLEWRAFVLLAAFSLVTWALFTFLPESLSF